MNIWSPMIGLDIVQMFRMLFKSRKVSRTRVHHKDTIQAFDQKQLDHCSFGQYWFANYRLRRMYAIVAAELAHLNCGSQHFWPNLLQAVSVFKFQYSYGWFGFRYKCCRRCCPHTEWDGFDTFQPRELCSGARRINDQALQIHGQILRGCFS